MNNKYCINITIRIEILFIINILDPSSFDEFLRKYHHTYCRLVLGHRFDGICENLLKTDFHHHLLL